MSALVAGAVGIAFAPIFVRWAIAADVGPTVAAFHRLALAAPVLWLWAAFSRRATPRRPRDAVRLVVPGLLFALDIGTWHWSIRYTSVANSTLLANVAPVFVTLGGWVIWRRRVRGLFVAGLVVALGGAVVLVGDSFRLGRDQAFGDALGLLTAVFYASYILAVGRLREEYPTATIMAWSATAAAVALLPMCLLAGEPLLPPSAHAWLVLAGLALVSHVGGQGLIAYALAHLPASFSSVTLLLQPVCATLLAWWFFAEGMGAWQAAGALIVVAGILIARRGSSTSA